MRKQLFNFSWDTPKAGGRFKQTRDIAHAIGNSDQYPYPFGESRIQNETIEAVVNAIEAAPEYEVRHRVMVDALGLVNAVRDMKGDIAQVDIINTIANLQEEVFDLERVGEL